MNSLRRMVSAALIFLLSGRVFMLGVAADFYGDYERFTSDPYGFLRDWLYEAGYEAGNSYTFTGEEIKNRLLRIPCLSVFPV